MMSWEFVFGCGFSVFMDLIVDLIVQHSHERNISIHVNANDEQFRKKGSCGVNGKCRK